MPCGYCTDGRADPDDVWLSISPMVERSLLGWEVTRQHWTSVNRIKSNNIIRDYWKLPWRSKFGEASILAIASSFLHGRSNTTAICRAWLLNIYRYIDLCIYVKHMYIYIYLYKFSMLPTSCMVRSYIVFLDNVMHDVEVLCVWNQILDCFSISASTSSHRRAEPQALRT